MKLQAEKMSEREASPDLVLELIQNASRRGEYMIMMHDDDDEAYVQIACDFDEIGDKDDGCFDLEYREGKEGNLFHCTKRVPATEIETIFLKELDGVTTWREQYPWEKKLRGSVPRKSGNSEGPSLASPD